MLHNNDILNHYSNHWRIQPLILVRHAGQSGQRSEAWDGFSGDVNHFASGRC